MFPRPTMDNLVVAFRFASLTAPAGTVDNRQADSQVIHSLPTRFAYGLTRRSAPCRDLEVMQTAKTPLSRSNS
jgi:hypothetical protein